MVDRDELLTRLSDRASLWEGWLRVKENAGCRGADGVSLSAFRRHVDWEIDGLQDSLLRCRYRPFPLLRFSIAKPAGGARYLSVPTLRDRVLQSTVYLLAGPLFEKEFEDSSFAYRPGRSVRQAVERIREHQAQGYRYVLDADIDSYFDSIPHDLLLRRLEALGLPTYVHRLFELWVKCEVYDGKGVRSLEKGIPQGSVVSPMLANLYLDTLDERLEKAGQVLVRYADDFVVLAKDPAGAEAALELTDSVLDELGLELHEGKTKIRSFEEGFRFLGKVFFRDHVYARSPRASKKAQQPSLPSPLTLARYMALKGAPVPPTQSSWPQNGPRALLQYLEDQEARAALVRRWNR